MDQWLASRYHKGAMKSRRKPWVQLFHLQEASGSRRELLEQIQIAIVSGVFGIVRPIGDELAGIDESLHNWRERFGLEAEELVHVTLRFRCRFSALHVHERHLRS